MSQFYARTIRVFRWATFVPCGVIASILASIVVATAWRNVDDADFLALINTIPANLAGGIALVYAGAWIAPSESKRSPVLIMAAIGYLIVVLGLPFALQRGDWDNVMLYAANAIGVTIALVHSLQDE